MFGNLCYEKCKEGFKVMTELDKVVDVGEKCIKDGCPEGFRDDGLTCAKVLKTKGRGAGYVVWDKKKCKKRHGSCEKCLGMYYPKCDEGYHAVGCNLCERSSSCPSGYKDLDLFCSKNIYSRCKGEEAI